MKRIPKLSVVKQAVSVIPIYLSPRRWSVPLLLWSIGVGILIGLAPTNAAAQQSTLRLGSTFNGLNLNLIFPVTTAANKLYYHMDHNGNGNASGEGDSFNHNTLDALINSFNDTIATQPGGHDGSKDERSLIVGSYTLVLPTVAELQALYADQSNRIPSNWSTSSYHAADSVGGVGTQEHRVFNLDNGAATNVRDGVRHPIAFQVIVVTPAAPAAPTGLTATPERESLIVRWTPVPDKDNGGAAITSYTVSATAPGQDTRSCTANGATASTCTIENLAGGVAYTVTVTATNSVGTASSAGITATPLAGFPDAPTDVMLTPGDELIIVTWRHVPAANDGGGTINGYTATATADGQPTQTCTANGATATTCTIRDLTNGTQYRVVVTAANSAGNSPDSAAVMVIPGIPTAAPTAVTALPTTDAALRITWTAVPDADNDGSPITGYTATATADGQPTRSCTADGATATTCDITDLTNNVAYDVIVVATNAYGSSPDSDADRVAPGRPAAPTDVTLIPGDGQIIVIWTPVPAANNGGSTIIRYEVAADISAEEARMRGVDGGIRGRCTVPRGAATTCALNNLDNGAEHRVVVVAVNSNGNSFSSDPVRTTPMPSLPLMLAPITDQAYFVGQSVSLTLPISGGGTGMFTYTLTPTVNIPAGLTFSPTERTLTGIPTATAATVLTYTATDTNNAATTSQTFSITITIPATITWTGGNFVETAANDGEVMGVLTATLTGDTFVARPGDATRLPSGSFITGGGIPNGLDYVVTRTSPTVVTVALSGNADSHTNADDRLSGRDGISISFGDFAFTNFLGVQVANREKIDLTIDYLDPYPLLLTGAIDDQTWLVGQAVSLTLPEATGGTAPLSYALTRSGDTPVLPSSVTFNAAARTISGTPNITFGGTTGTSLVWTVTDSASTPIVAMQTFSVIVNIPAPTGVTAIPADDASLTIRWTPVPAINNGGAKITTYTATATATGQPTQTCTATGAITNTCTISGLTNGTEYSITVVATNNIGIGIASEPVRAVPGVPAAPTDVTLTTGDEQIIVTWTPVPAANNGGAEIISYTADPFPDGGGLLGHLTCTVLGATANTCGITGLTNGIRYRVIVRAKNIRGESIASASVLATPEPSSTPILAPIADQTYVVGQRISLILPRSGGGASTITYTLTPADNIPAGLTFTPADRTLSGIATATTVAALTYTVTDANNATASQTFSITITPPDPLVFDISVIPAPDTAYTYTFNTLITPLTLPPATGGVLSLAYTLSDVPNGLNFNPDTRVLSGRPTTGSSTTDLNYVVTDSAAMPNVSTLTFSVTVTSAAQPDVLRFGTVSGINLDLIFPVITAEGKVYYYLDHDGNRNSGGTDDERTHEQLDTLLNGGDNTIVTQEGNHDGSDDERSALASAYILVLPTIAEFDTLYADQGDAIPPEWGNPLNRFIIPYFWTADLHGSGSSGTHRLSQFGSNPTVGGDDTFNHVVFQVIGRLPTAPAAPTSVTATPAAGSLTIRWIPVPEIDNGGAEITTYTATAEATGQTTRTCNANGAAATTCDITGLTGGVEYSVAVVATNSEGTARSTAITATPLALTVPAAPTGVTLTPEDAQIIVMWMPVPTADNGGAPITAYNATATNIADDSDTFTCRRTGPTDASCVITGLTNGTTYRIIVIATNSIGDSPDSRAVRAIPGVPTAAPTDVTLTPGDEQIIVTWTPVPVANNGGAPVTSYTAYPFPDGGGLLGNLICTATGASANICGITGLTNGIRYRVVVRARNIRGESIASAGVFATSAPSSTPILVPIADQTYPVGQEVSFILPKSGGGASTLTYTLTPADNIPAGLTFTPADRSLTGIPTATTVAALTYTVTDANNATASQTFSITITPPDPLVFDISVIPAPDAAYTYTFNTLIAPLTLPPAAGGVAPLTYTLSDVPDDLNFNEDTRVLSGRPAAVTSATELSYVVADSAATTNTSTLTFSVTVIAGDQSEVLTLGIVDDINLNLIFPVTTDNGKVYYYLDHDGNGNSTGNGDRRTHDQLDTLLNKGDDTIDTQPSGHDGGDDERSVIAGSYTLVLPTRAEIGVLRTDQGNEEPPNWSDLRYHTSNRDAANQHNAYSFSDGSVEVIPDSTERSVVFQVIARTPTAPAAPTSITVATADSSLTVTWTPVPNIDNGGAEISTYTATATDTTDNNNIFTCTANGAMASTCTMTGLSNGTEYRITVVATNRIGSSVASAAATATPVGVPAAPIGVSAIPADSSLTVTWTPVPNIDNGGAEISTYTATATASGQPTRTCTATGAMANTCIITGLTNDIEYSIIVVATNRVGNSPDSTVITATPTTAPITENLLFRIKVFLEGAQ